MVYEEGWAPEFSSFAQWSSIVRMHGESRDISRNKLNVLEIGSYEDWRFGR